MAFTSDLSSYPKIGEYHVYEWRGSAHEIGRQHGRALREQIVQEFAPELGQLTQNTSQSETKILERYRALYEPLFREFLPRTIEEIEGLAQGAELTYEQAFFAATRDGAKCHKVVDTPEGCTAFFCGSPTTRSNNALMGQTKDTSAPLARYRIMRIHYSDGLSMILLNYPGWLSHMGLSSHGLANTGNSLFAHPSEGNTVPFSFIKRLAMEKETVEEVLAICESLPFENCCLMLGSSSNEGVCLEFVAGKRSIRDISNEAFGHANSILDPSLQSHETTSTDPFSDLVSSKYRKNQIQQLLDNGKGRLNCEELKKFVADHHNHPNGICRHGRCGESRTTAAFIANLTDRKVHICIGNPCAAAFTEYSLQRSTARWLHFKHHATDTSAFYSSSASTIRLA